MRRSLYVRTTLRPRFSAGRRAFFRPRPCADSAAQSVESAYEDTRISVDDGVRLQVLLTVHPTSRARKRHAVVREAVRAVSNRGGRIAAGQRRCHPCRFGPPACFGRGSRSDHPSTHGTCVTAVLQVTAQDARRDSRTPCGSRTAGPILGGTDSVRPNDVGCLLSPES